MIEWLLNVVSRAKLHRLDGTFDGAVARHDDELDVRVFALDGAQQLDAIHLRHLKIGKHKVDVAILCKQRKRFTRRGYGARLIAAAFEQARAHGAVLGVILDDEDSSGINQPGPPP